MGETPLNALLPIIFSSSAARVYHNYFPIEPDDAGVALGFEIGGDDYQIIFILE